MLCKLSAVSSSCIITAVTMVQYDSPKKLVIHLIQTVSTLSSPNSNKHKFHPFDTQVDVESQYKIWEQEFVFVSRISMDIVNFPSPFNTLKNDDS